MTLQSAKTTATWLLQRNGFQSELMAAEKCWESGVPALNHTPNIDKMPRDVVNAIKAVDKLVTH